jgi:hypothetical protein
VFLILRQSESAGTSRVAGNLDSLSVRGAKIFEQFSWRFTSLIDMPRKLRHIPEGGSLVEVTCRTVQSRLLLTPRPFVWEIVIGILARAKRMYPVQLICFTFMTTQSLCLALSSPLLSVNSVG